MDNNLRFPHLLKADFLRNLSASFQKEILNSCNVLSYNTPRNVLSQGQPSEGLFIVAHGSVDVVCLGQQGQRVFITRFDAGRTFGDIEAIADQPCAANCIAEKNTVLLFCPKQQLLAHLKSVEYVRNMVAEFHRKLARDNAFKLIDQTSSVSHRLAVYLHFLSEKNCQIDKTQANLAEIVRCSRQTMNKELGKLRDRGLIEIRNRSVIVKDRQKLQEILTASFGGYDDLSNH